MTQVENHITTFYDNNLMEKIVESGNLQKALEHVEGNKGAGIDGMQPYELRQFLNENGNLARIKQELLDGTYKPALVRRIEIPKPDGGVRILGIPTVRDRFIQQTIQQVLTPIFEPMFSQSSYGFRSGKGPKQAARQAQRYIRSGKIIVVDIDIEKFFDCVNHDLLMSKLAEQIRDKRIHKIIRKYLQAGVMSGDGPLTEEGIVQGAPLSPLLANIMLNDLDQELVRRELAFVRYVDDCNIYVNSMRAGLRIYKNIGEFIQKRLKLKVNENKSAVDYASNRKFLGFSFTHCEQANLRVARKSQRKVKAKICKLTSRSKCISMKKRLEDLNTYTIGRPEYGWLKYYGITKQTKLFFDLDQWIMFRLRICLLKQWKCKKTMIRNLIKLGMDQNKAKHIAFSHKQYCKFASEPQISKILGLTYWKNQGFIPLSNKNRKMPESL